MRSAIAVLIGMVLFSFASVVFLQLTGRPPEVWPGLQFAAIAVTYGAILAGVAGYVSARLAPDAPFAHAAGFAALLLAIATASYLIQPVGASPWSLVATILFSIPAALAGGLLRAKHVRHPTP